jgi:hypothetical protein
MSTFAPMQNQAQKPGSHLTSHSNSSIIEPLRPTLFMPRPGWDKDTSQDAPDTREARFGFETATRLSPGPGPMPVQPLLRGFVQAKLKVSSPEDIYEQEADLVSEQVLRMPEQELPHVGAAGHTEPVHSQTKPSQSGSLGWSSTGQPLDAAARSFMEPRLGFDFSRVRIHTDARAAESADKIHALAYTVGRDIVFARDKYRLGSSEGRRLLAHELTHVVQQGAVYPFRSPVDGLPESVPLAATGRHLNAPAPILQRKTSPIASPVTSPVTSPPPFSDAQVQKLIDDTLKSHSNDVFASAAFLNTERDKPENQGDENMAAAEHYFYARAAGSLGFNAPNGVLAYAFLKKIGVKVPLGSGPVTPTSAGQIKWGLRGATDGYKDLFHRVF